MKSQRLEIRLSETEKAKFNQLADTLGVSLVDMIREAVSELELQVKPDYYAEADKILEQLFRLQQVMDPPIMEEVKLTEAEQDLYDRLEYAYEAICFSKIVQEDKRSYVEDEESIERFKHSADKDPLAS